MGGQGPEHSRVPPAPAISDHVETALRSTGGDSQLQATQVAFFFFLPSVLLSGFMFPFEAMPAPGRWLGELLALTHFIRLCRGILLRSSTLADLPVSLLALLVMTAGGFAVATQLFRKRLG